MSTPPRKARPGAASPRHGGRAPPAADAARAPEAARPAGDEGAPVGTGTPLAHAPLPPSSGQAGAKKG